MPAARDGSSRRRALHRQGQESAPRGDRGRSRRGRGGRGRHSLKPLFFGTSEFAVPVLAAVAEAGSVAGVVTQPDRQAGRGHRVAATPVKRAAEALGLPVFTPERLRSFVDDARASGADAFVVASYGKIVPQMLLDLVPVAFNVHPSLLPLYRGATPLQSALRDGRAATGVTIIAMDAGMDTGDVLLQERTPIGERETYGELHDRLAARGAALVVEAMRRYADGTLAPRTQREVAAEYGISDEEIERTLTRPLTKDDLSIDWNHSAREIVDLVRSLAPQPLARAAFAGETLKIVEARAVSRDALHDELGGTVLFPTSGLAVAERRLFAVPGVSNAGEAVIVDRVIAPNRGAMTGEAFARRTFALQRR